jgi:fucose 4-O-acetylase-like acetyltransferase
MVAENELYGMYEMWHEPFWQTTYFLIAVGITAFSCVLVAGWFYYKKRRSKQMVQSCWQVALIRLQDLQKTDRITPDHCKEFYFVLTHILKNYLHERYNFDLVGKTDEEVITYLATTDFPPELLTMLESIFNGCVIVKFANMQAIQATIERDFAAADTLVKRTIPVTEK